MSSRNGDEVERLSPGIEGLDLVLNGGLPRARLSLVAGTAGSGKTLFATQFLAAGVVAGEPGVFVTFEERPDSIRANFRSFGWDVEAWERDGSWTFVDASPQPGDHTIVEGEYDLASLVVRVRHAVEQSGAKRVAIDSTGALIDEFGDTGTARRALFEISNELRAMDVTTVMTVERADDYGPVSRNGFEEFISDGVVILRNALEGEKRRRTVEALKLRGGSHLRGEHLYTLVPGRGMVVVPQEALTFGRGTSNTRLTTGVPALDEMCGGGLFDRSLTLLTGSTGTGKSMLSTQFVAGGARAGEKSLLFSFEESADQLRRNAATWGIDFERLVAEGTLRVVAVVPEGATLEDHLLHLKSEIKTFAPDRVALDSLTALQRVATAQSFREYLLGLSFHIKSEAVVGLITATTNDVGGGGGLTGELHLSTVSDTVILLQYVGRRARIDRAVTVLKMRGSDHDKALRQFTIDETGMQIGEPLELRTWTQLPQVL